MAHHQDLTPAIERFLEDFAQFLNVPTIALDPDGECDFTYADVDFTLKYAGRDKFFIVHTLDSARIPNEDSTDGLFLAANYQTVLQNRGQVALDLEGARYVWLDTIPFMGLTSQTLLEFIASASQVVGDLYARLSEELDDDEDDADDLALDPGQDNAAAVWIRG